MTVDPASPPLAAGGDAARPETEPSGADQVRVRPDRGVGGSFLRVVRAELRRYARPRAAIAIALGAALFAAVSSITVWLTAEAEVERSRDGAASLVDLAATGGATEAFAVGASFGGLVVLVTFIAVMGNDLVDGTYRALLLVYPRRGRLLVGKMAGLLLVTTAAVTLAEALSVVLSLILAPTRDVSTGEWWTLAGLGDGLFDLATVLAGLAGWAVLGTLLVALVRSVPIALGIGIAWSGPGENFVFESWEPSTRWFPGQVLGSLMRGGTIELDLDRALLTALAYGAVALLAVVALSRRDVAR